MSVHAGNDQSGHIVYEVNLAVQPGVVDAFRAWLHRHVDEMVAIDGFTGAEIRELTEPRDPEAAVTWSVRYYLESEAALENYLRDHAERMRADGMQRFGGRFTASRRILGPVLGAPNGD